MWVSDRCGRARNNLQHDVIVTKTSQVFVLQQESSDDRGSPVFSSRSIAFES